MLAEEDRAGRAWSKAHGYGGYTSYASLDDLPTRDPVFGELKRRLDRHAKAFAEALAFDLRPRGRLKLDSLWVNVLKPGRRPLRPHPPPQRAVGHGLCGHPARRGRPEARGPAPADDDGRPAPPRRRAGGPAQLRHPGAGAGHGAAVGELAAPRGAGQPRQARRASASASTTAGCDRNRPQRRMFSRQETHNENPCPYPRRRAGRRRRLRALDGRAPDRRRGAGVAEAPTTGASACTSRRSTASPPSTATPSTCASACATTTSSNCSAPAGTSTGTCRWRCARAAAARSPATRSGWR